MKVPSDPLAPRVGGPRRGPLFFTLALVLLAAAPVLQNWAEEPVDDFPLSYFPMFTTVREGRTNLNHPIGIRADGTVVDLSYRTVGSGGMNQVRRQINRYVDEDRVEDLLDRVVEGVRARKLDRREDLAEVWIVRDRYEFDRYFRGEKEPARRRVLGRRELERGREREEAR